MALAWPRQKSSAMSACLHVQRTFHGSRMHLETTCQARDTHLSGPQGTHTERSISAPVLQLGGQEPHPGWFDDPGGLKGAD